MGSDAAELTRLKKPTPRDPSGTIQRILVAAREEFGLHGFEGARIERVAHRANVSKQLVYRYFASKDELYSEVVRSISRRNHEALLKIDFASLDPLQAIRTYVASVFDCFANDPTAAFMTMDQGARGGAELNFGPTGKRLREMLRLKVADAFERGRAEGVIGANTDLASLEFMTMIITAGCVSSRGAFADHLGHKAFEDEGLDYWRDYSVNFIMQALRP